jgi:hypothetical protein
MPFRVQTVSGRCPARSKSTPEKVRACFLGKKAIRKEAAHEIERLITLLDRLDPNPHLEENGTTTSIYPRKNRRLDQ